MSKACDNFVSKCKDFYQEADTDGNGVQVGELVKIIRRVSNCELSDAELAEMFLDLDDNNDKTLSWDEFEDVFKKKNPKNVQKSELLGVFKEMDGAGDGCLDPNDIKASYEKLEICISPEALEAIFEKVDKDGDGKINYDEFLKMWSAA